VGTNINFTQGTLNQTGNPLNVAIGGNGFFVTLNGSQQTYTRAGQFQFNSAGILINEADGQQVAGISSDGKLSNISLTLLQNNAAKATTTVTLTGALSNTYATVTPAGSAPAVSGIAVTDPAGGQHTLALSFSLVTPAATAGTDVWTVTAKDSTGATVGTGTISYANGTPVSGSDTISLSYAPSGVTAFPIKLDFSGTSSSALGATSTIASGTVDGNAAGTLVSETFDSTGMLVATYSNGQTANGPHLALAYFNSNQELTETSGNNFVANNPSDAKFGIAGTGSLGTITAGSIEGSNVNLSQEFSNLIVMQRGYQAASQVLSTANDMIQTLFDMKKQ